MFPLQRGPSKAPHKVRVLAFRIFNESSGGSGRAVGASGSSHPGLDRCPS